MTNKEKTQRFNELIANKDFKELNNFIINETESNFKISKGYTIKQFIRILAKNGWASYPLEIKDEIGNDNIPCLTTGRGPYYTDKNNRIVSRTYRGARYNASTNKLIVYSQSLAMMLLELGELAEIYIKTNYKFPCDTTYHGYCLFGLEPIRYKTYRIYKGLKKKTRNIIYIVIHANIATIIFNDNESLDEIITDAKKNIDTKYQILSEIPHMLRF